MKLEQLRQQIRQFLKFCLPHSAGLFTTHQVSAEAGYSRALISYDSDEEDTIPAYLLLPTTPGPWPAVLVHHQHHGQRHLGKSEVCGLAGDPGQAFGPALARQGIAVLAPDSICFEDRRQNHSGTEPHHLDTAQHFNEMSHRLVRGDTLMRKVLDDSARGIDLLLAHPQVDNRRVGLMGHSYGGQTVLFHAPLDSRIRFACASGAASTYQYKLNNKLGIEMAGIIPGFAARFEISDLLSCMAPRPMLLVSADEDTHSVDAHLILQEAKPYYDALGAGEQLQHRRYQGGHSVTPERFDHIVQWLMLMAQAS